MALLTRYVDHLNGDDGRNGEGEGTSWQHIYKAMGVIKTDAGANGWKIYVKASEDYIEPDDANHNGAAGTAVLYLDLAGALSKPITWEGYYEVPGDGGIAIFDADANGLTNVVQENIGANAYMTFKNISFEGASSHGVNWPGVTSCSFYNCRFFNNGGIGVTVASKMNLINCLVDNNGSNGLSAGYYCAFISCIFRGNTGFGCRPYAGYIIDSLFYGNTSTAIYNDFYLGNALLSTTVNGNSNDGYNNADTAGILAVVANNIFYNCNGGCIAAKDMGEMRVLRNNLFDQVTTPVDTEWPAIADRDWRQNIISPAEKTFTNAGDNDYTLSLDSANTSEALQAGIDAQYTLDYWTSYINGSNPPLRDQ
jgi:hypothetical protein